MNILAISTLFPSTNMPSYGIFVFNRLNEMALLEGNEITVLNPIPSSPLHKIMPRYKEQQKEITSELESNFKSIMRINYLSIPKILKSTEHLFLIASTVKKIEELHKEKPFDHIDVHWCYPDLPLGIEIAKRLGITCTVTLRGMETFYLDDNDGRSSIIAKSLSQVDGVISLSKEMLDKSMEMAPNINNYSLVYNGVDNKVFKFKDKSEARSELSIKKDDLLILGVGSLIKRKGFHHIIQSLPEIKSKHPEKSIRYVIAGSTSLEGDFSEIKELAKDVMNKNPGVYVEFVGQKDNSELPTWYAAADVFCLSSFGEGSPNVLSEALSCGCPSASSDVGSASELMARAGKNAGTLLSSQESEEFASSNWAKAICKVIDSKTNREELAGKMKKFTWRRCAKEAMKLITEVVGK